MEREEMSPTSFYKINITLMPKQDKDTTKKNKIVHQFFDEHRCKNSQ
jgi:hypothetical protein